MQVNYDHTYEEQHESVIANIIKRVVPCRNRLTYSRYKRNTPNLKHLNGDAGSERLLEILFVTGDAVYLSSSERPIRMASPGSEGDPPKQMHSINDAPHLPEGMEMNEDE